MKTYTIAIRVVAEYALEIEAENQDDAINKVDAMSPHEIKEQGSLVDESPDGAAVQ